MLTLNASGKAQEELDQLSQRWLDLLSGHVIDLLIGRIAKIPAACKLVLQHLACIGMNSDTDLLACLCDINDDAFSAAVSQLTTNGLLVRQGASLAFQHDRVFEAAYALIDADSKSSAHARVARRMVAFRQPLSWPAREQPRARYVCGFFVSIEILTYLLNSPVYAVNTLNDEPAGSSASVTSPRPFFTTTPRKSIERGSHPFCRMVLRNVCAIEQFTTRRIRNAYRS